MSGNCSQGAELKARVQALETRMEVVEKMEPRMSLIEKLVAVVQEQINGINNSTTKIEGSVQYLMRGIIGVLFGILAILASVWLQN